MNKRCYSVLEARAYLGLKRRSFEAHIVPRLQGKGTKVGTTVLFDRSDLDAAWEAFKLAVGEERSGPKGGKEWGVQKYRASTRESNGKAGKSTPVTKVSAFADAVLQVQRKPKVS